MAIELIRCAETLGDPARKISGLIVGLESAQKDGELIAAKPGDKCSLAGNRAQTGRGLFQNLIADRMPKRVIDLLESIKVDGEESETSARLCGVRSIGQGSREGASVRQPGQFVMRGKI